MDLGKGMIYLMIFSLVVISCKKEKFNTKNTDFQKAFNEKLDAGSESAITMDTEVHSYTFVLSEDKSLASIGYQSVEAIETANYLIEIRDNSDSSLVYSEESTFKSNKMSYITAGAPIVLQGGVSYSISRIQTNWTGNITNTIGHLVKTSESDYPISYGILTITESNFHDHGKNDTNLRYYALPRIDMELK